MPASSGLQTISAPPAALCLTKGRPRPSLPSTPRLPVGVIGVKGEFVRGEVVSCLTEDGCEIARGLVNYSSDDASRILRAHTEEIEERLGYMEQPEMIHRDNMVVLAGE